MNLTLMSGGSPGSPTTPASPAIFRLPIWALSGGGSPGVVSPTPATPLVISLGDWLILMNAGGPTPVLPGTFLAAVRGRLRGDGTLAAATNGHVWKDVAPRGIPYPFIVIEEGSRSPEYSTIDQDGFIPYTDHATFSITAYHRDPQSAIAIAKRVIAVLDDSPLLFSEGELLEIRHDQGYQMLKTTERGFGGANIFQVVIPYEASIQKLFPFNS